MASIGKPHLELDEQGIGKCSVPEDNTSLPMKYIIRHGIGVSVPAPHPAPEPEKSPELVQAVEQSENKQDCPSRLGDVVERLSNFRGQVEQLRQQIGKEMLAHQTAEKCAIGLQQQLAQIRDATFTTVGCWECPNAIQAAQTIAALRLENANLKNTQFWSNRFPCPITTTTIDGVEYYLKHECLRMFHDLKRDNAQKDARIAELEEGR